MLGQVLSGMVVWPNFKLQKVARRHHKGHQVLELLAARFLLQTFFFLLLAPSARPASSGWPVARFRRLARRSPRRNCVVGLSANASSLPAPSPTSEGQGPILQLGFTVVCESGFNDLVPLAGWTSTL